MARRRLYLPLIVDYFDDPKMIDAADESPWAEVLYIRLCCVVKDLATEGNATKAHMIRTRVPQWQKHAATLVAVGALTVTEDGWRINAWTNHNLLNEQVEQRQAALRERVARSREAKKAPPVTPGPKPGNTAGNGTGNTLGNALPLNSKLEARRAESFESPETSARTNESSLERQGAKKPNPLFDALAQHAEGIPPGSKIGRRQARAIAVAAADIARTGAVPEQVPAAVAAFRRQFDGASVTANAIAKHWARLRPGAGIDPAKPQHTNRSTPASRMGALADRQLAIAANPTATASLLEIGAAL